MEKVNIAQKLALIAEHWRPKVVGELNGQEVKLVKLLGTFVWHHHEQEAAVLVFEPADTRNMGNVEDAKLTSPLGVRI